MSRRSWMYLCANFSGVLYSTFLILAVLLLNLLYTCPGVYGAESCAPVHFHAALIFLEVVGNLFLFHYYNCKNRVAYWTVKSSAIPEGDADADLPLTAPPRPAAAGGRLVITEEGVYRKEQWLPDAAPAPAARTRFCEECRAVMPRRAHHCPLCGICVLRKDHHCFITGGCVGLANQRYFIVFLLWACVGAAYGSFFTFSFIHHKLVNQWFPTEWLRFLAPISLVRWLLGYDTFYTMMFSVIGCASVASCLAAAGFFVTQIFYTLQGYTLYDYHVGRFRDHLDADGENWQERLALVFGKRWWLNFLFPQFWLPNQLTPQIARNIFLSVSKDL